MGTIIIHNDKIRDPKAFAAVCPFGALTVTEEGKVELNAACRSCKLCVKRATAGEATYEEDAPIKAEEGYSGVAVYADLSEGRLHPVTEELIGKGRELADKCHQPLYCLVIGQATEQVVARLRRFPLDGIYVFDAEPLAVYRAEPYVAAFEAFIRRVRPASVLVGATVIGRQLAPRVAARFGTGLTADCTVLDMEEDGSLVQIRPAFGGNIMAQIACPARRPQMATVRYKIMQALPAADREGDMPVVRMTLPSLAMASGVTVRAVSPKERVRSIEQAERIVAIGRGVSSPKDREAAEAFARAIGAELACTRPLVEQGQMEARRQIGLSGRTVRPKLIVTLGISGAVQFAAGMQSAECIIAVNRDPDAPIFQIAHYGVVGDVSEVLPLLLEKIEGRNRP